MDDAALMQLRAICLALPEAAEDGAGVGSPSFKVRDRIFAMRHGMNGRQSMWCKAPTGAQAAFVGAEAAGGPAGPAPGQPAHA